jgi:predicted MPP superfamily phosphohydrolase
MIFFAVFCSVLGLLHYYVGRRLFHDTRLPVRLQRSAWTFIAALALSIPAAFTLGMRGQRALALWPSRIAYGWLGCLFYLGVMFGARDALRALVNAPGQWLSWLQRLRAGSQAAANAEQASPHEALSRRVFVARALASASSLAAVSTAGFGIHAGLGEITTPEVPVRLARLPRALDGFRIAQISDVHIGPMLGERFLRAVIETTLRLKPDLIVITGDLVDGSVAVLGHEIGLLSKLRARHGTYFVTGNHEYYSGCDPWVVFLEQLGIPVLMNERVAIGDSGPGGASFDLLGVPDHHATRYPAIAPNMQLAAKGRDPERELVVLAHQPVQIAQAIEVGAGLQLSGHTHGGQIQPFGALVMLAQPYLAGLHRRADTQIYVSRGTGFWGPPMRVLAPAEIATITLVAG